MRCSLSGLAIPCFMLVTLLAGLVATDAFADVVYVDVDRDGPGDGLAWETAFVSIESALAASSAGDELWIAAGTYPCK